ncbi:hypothetical protein XU06_29460 (plasmid) [Rhodococcus erythropolis]|uniref:hypothetical protein n=1 Tax=Rhodococcus erythropolis TaxID=1833 RepID=UPI00061B6FED|nr:hypothetical protein [Rhodococcus erythropolis]AKE01106.1 hypothetical protein XU06_29460 [Rhodococcus erythropolis]
MLNNWHWVQKKIDTLDPDTQYNEIIRLQANYLFKPFFMNLNYIQAVAGTQLPGGEILIAAGKSVTNAEARVNGTMETFFTWMFNGTDSDVTKASVEKLNRYHLSHAKKFPGYFDDNVGYLHATCAIGLIGPRFRETFGLSPQSDRLNKAWYNFLADIIEMLRGEHGQIQDFPEDFESMRKFVEDYEGRDWPQTNTGKVFMEGVVQDFADRMFPRGLGWFGRNLALFAVPKAVRRVHRMPDPGRFSGPLVRFFIRTMAMAQEKVLPDPRVPLSVIWASPEYKEKVVKRNKRMQEIKAKRVASGEIILPKFTPGMPRPELARTLEEQYAEKAAKVGAR